MSERRANLEKDDVRADLAAIPGKADTAGVVIWYLYGLHKDTTVTLANGLLEQFHISRKAKYRCLKALEGAELIAVEYHKDRNPQSPLLPPGSRKQPGKILGQCSAPVDTVKLKTPAGHRTGDPPLSRLSGMRGACINDGCCFAISDKHDKQI